MPKTNMFDPNNFSEGGGSSLAGVIGIVVSSLFKWTNWAKEDGSIPTYRQGPNKGEPVKPSTVLELVVQKEGEDTQTHALISASGILMPSKDGVTVAKDKTGPFLVHPDGKENVSLNKGSAVATLIESLANASFDTDLMNESGSVALEGYCFAFDEKQPERKDADGKPIGKALTVVTKIVHGPGKSAKAGARGKVAAPVKGKAKPAPEPEEDEEEAGEIDHEATLTEVISEILADESPLAKAKVSMAVNKKLAALGLEQQDRLKMLKLATSDEFLAAGPWAYDKKSLAAL